MKPHINFSEKNGALIIKISIHSQGRGVYSTGISIDSEQWNEEKQESNDPDINLWMFTTKSTLQRSFRPDMDPKRLWMSFVNNQAETKATIEDAFKYYLANMPLRDNSKSVYVSVSNSLQRAGIYNTLLSEVTPGILRAYVNGLKIGQASKFNSFVRLKAAIVRYIKDHQLSIIIDFDGIIKKPRYVMKENQWLTLAQFKELWALKLTKSTKEARDLFCLCCFTGMSMSDALAFEPKSNIKKRKGREFIEYTRIKTGSQCRVPVLSETKEIIESRNWPAQINIRAYQYQVDKLGEMIGVQLNTHMARKTFGALMLEFGFSIETVSKLLGHANTTLTQKTYAIVTQEKIERELMEIGI